MTTTAPTMLEIPRDRYGRPLVAPPGGGDLVPYTRVSTIAKLLDDTSALEAWKQRMVAVGVATNPHLRTRVQGVVNLYDDPIKEGRRDLNSICEEARTTAGATKAASSGTGYHELTQAIDLGRTLTGIDPDMRAHLDEYARATAHLEHVEIERFVVNDEIQAAGTPDRFVRIPDGRVICADLKTGANEPQYPRGVTIQEAIYSNASNYNPETFERTPIHPDLDPTLGLLIHMPLTGPPTTRLYWLNLERGWAEARVAANLHKIRATKAHEYIREAS